MNNSTNNETAFNEAMTRLEEQARQVPNTKMLALAKIHALVALNMRIERLVFDSTLSTSPYVAARAYVEHATHEIESWNQIRFIENEQNTLNDSKSPKLEQKHHALFQDLWVRFNSDEYTERIERYVYRLKLNKLDGDFLRGKHCLDVGCGHGNFAIACVRSGAKSAVGIDYGENSVAFATNAAKSLKEDRVEYKVASAYQLPFPDGTFDLVIQNGVFHHLENEDAAIAEIQRVTRQGGWLWYYTDGGNGIFHRVWDASVRMLSSIPHALIVQHLEYLNLSTNKRYHLGDGLNATYRHTTWEEITSRLAKFGFGSFRRLEGGFPTDMDGARLANDRYAEEKFGCGDLRVLCQKK